MRLLTVARILGIKKAGVVNQLVFSLPGHYFFLVGYYFRFEFAYGCRNRVSFTSSATYH